MNNSAFSDDYIVRIYRHDSCQAHRFIGTIEEVGKEGKLAFETIDELWSILSRKDHGQKKKRKIQEIMEDIEISITNDCKEVLETDRNVQQLITHKEE